ncbi:hypothetical protein HPP92_019069 [Vanilla planifolia]|uniref:Uncharacterized protein n=1 Tax=Vanilla planifolia TaxID=51239 RepID=A0A835QD96_VANPL|nr:hypothetical protein HPP92_019069 [Vanilla planifolia]
MKRDDFDYYNKGDRVEATCVRLSVLAKERRPSWKRPSSSRRRPSERTRVFFVHGGRGERLYSRVGIEYSGLMKRKRTM